MCNYLKYKKSKNLLNKITRFAKFSYTTDYIVKNEAVIFDIFSDFLIKIK